MSDANNNKVVKKPASGLRLVHDADVKVVAPPTPTPLPKQTLSPKSKFASMLSQAADQIDRDIQFIMKF